MFTCHQEGWSWHFIKKLFSSGPSHTETGAMYEVVTGIPKVVYNAYTNLSIKFIYFQVGGNV